MHLCSYIYTMANYLFFAILHTYLNPKERQHISCYCIWPMFSTPIVTAWWQTLNKLSLYKTTWNNPYTPQLLNLNAKIINSSKTPQIKMGENTLRLR